MTMLAYTWWTAWRAAWANRRGFATQVALMLANDVVWVGFWFLVFSEVGEIRGWRLDDVLLLFALLTASAGAALGAFHNSRQIGAVVLDGQLDTALSLPVPTLPYLLVRRVETLFVGDLLFGILLFAVLGDPTPQRTLLFLFGIVCGTTVIMGFLILVGSTVFVAGRNEAGEMGFHALLLLSSYPVDVFTGGAKLLLYVVVPSAFVTSIPARMVSEPDTTMLVAMAAVAAVFASAGWAAFTLGLRRHTSGALWHQA
ncbi:MAG: ABC-2 family transporter protein [Actinomycetota bacterium]